MKCKAALVVEDDLDLLSNFVVVLESEGYRVYAAENGQQALDLLAKLAPDDLPGCILLDLMMPIMDGKKFLEVLAKEHPDDWAKIPIFVATARGSHTARPEELAIPVETLRKPVELDDLVAAISRHCEKQAA